jgi:hypothetical protein
MTSQETPSNPKPPQSNTKRTSQKLTSVSSLKWHQMHLPPINLLNVPRLVMTEVILNDLPENHSLRNIPLVELKAFYKRPDAKVWQEMTPAYTIAKTKITFNQLGAVWKSDVWKATFIPSVDWDEGRMRVIGSNGNEGLHY